MPGQAVRTRRRPGEATVKDGRIGIVQVDAFTTAPYMGNPAGVALAGGESLTDGQMLAIAREMNLSETAFLLPPTLPGANVRIRWFTPTVEVQFCGHATVAAFHAAAEAGLWGFEGIAAGEERAVHMECLSGILPLQVRRDQAGIEVTMGLPVPGVRKHDDAAQALAALGLSGVAGGKPGSSETAADLPGALIGSPFLLVHVPDLRSLREASPDREAIVRLTGAEGCDGLIAATLETFDSGSAVHLRMFAPAAGIDEDPVTGYAQALTAMWLGRGGLLSGRSGERFRTLKEGVVAYIAEQGDFLGRPGRVGVEVSFERLGAETFVQEVSISGRAVTVLRGELPIPPGPALRSP